MDLDKALEVLRKMSEAAEDSGEKTFEAWRLPEAALYEGHYAEFYADMLEKADALKLAIELLS